MLFRSLAPYIATWLAANHGLRAVGYYLSAAGVVTLVALLAIQRRGAAARVGTFDVRESAL